MAIHDLDNLSPALPPAQHHWIAPGAQVIGDVTLGHEATIWFNAVIRGDNDPIVIGARSNVQDGAVLHSDPGVPLLIGDEVTIGHLAMVHSCTIGDRSLIGIGAVVLAGARIGSDCLIGAGALVTGNAAIPDGMMVIGRPARVARPLSPEEMASLRRSAASYADKGRRYASGLRERQQRP